MDIARGTDWTEREGLIGYNEGRPIGHNEEDRLDITRRLIGHDKETDWTEREGLIGHNEGGLIGHKERD